MKRKGQLKLTQIYCLTNSLLQEWRKKKNTQWNFLAYNRVSIMGDEQFVFVAKAVKLR